MDRSVMMSRHRAGHEGPRDFQSQRRDDSTFYEHKPDLSKWVVKHMPHSFHVSRPLDLWVFGIFRFIHHHERNAKGFGGETRK
jgi:hypothetical protein